MGDSLNNSLCTQNKDNQILNDKQAESFGENIDNLIDFSNEGLSKDFGAVSAGVLLDNRIDKIPTLLGDLYPKVGIVLLAGSSDAGKSMYNRNLALNLCAGLETFLDFQFAEDLIRRALVVCSEDDEFALSFLLGKQTFGFSKDEIKKVRDSLFFIFETEDIIEKLEGFLERKKVDLIIIDTLGDIPNDIKDNSEMRRLLSEFKRIAVTNECLIILMHHTNKRTENQAPNKSNIQGAGGMEQKCRLALELRSDPNDENLKHLSVLKGNYLSKEFKGSSFVLRFDSEDFTFTNTGDRVPFDDLIIISQEQKPKSNRLPSYDDIDINILRNIIIEIFDKNPSGFLLKDLTIRFSEKLQVRMNLSAKPGRDLTKDIITRMIMDGALLQPKKGSKVAFITFNHLFKKDPQTQLDQLN